MMQSGKETKFDQIKDDQFKTHTLWNDTEYFKTTKKWFRKKCERKQIVDPEITELRKSIPLYKDLSQSNTLVRQKYRGEGVNNAVVDFKSLAMSMICDGSRDSCITLAEMTLVRSSIGRGGEHIFLRYKEAAFDEYFQALDLDWPILKQTDRKCILIIRYTRAMQLVAIAITPEQWES